MRERLKPTRIILLVAMVAGALTMMFPFLWMLITSITPEGSLAGGPSLVVEHPTLGVNTQN